MKVKYFEAESREAAEEKAVAYFGDPESELQIEVVSGDDEKAAWQICAYSGSAHELANHNAGYAFYYEEDGVWFEVYAEKGSGSPIDKTVLSQFIKRKNINDFDDKSARTVLGPGTGRIKVAPSQTENIYGEDIIVKVTGDESEAYATLLPPEPGGVKLDLEAAKAKLAEAGVTHGIDDYALLNMLQEKAYDVSVLIANAIKPEDGQNGGLIFNFATDEKTGRPKELEGGKVDYKTLDLFEPVSEGQILITRTFATEGTPGVTVRGRELKQKPGKEAKLPRGKNVEIDEDKTEMRAKCSGMVEFINGSVNVSSIYMIKGDCGTNVGHVDFDGTVQITGNVMAGLVIRATGAVIIGGVVEAASIYAGGNVEVKGGFQGASRGRIEADGSVSLLYTEYATVVAGGAITVDASVHSILEAGDSIYAKGKRGAIIGGRAGAANMVVANSIGSVSHLQTEVAAGVMPRKRVRYEELEKLMDKIEGEMVKLDQLDAYLAKSKEKLDPDTYDKLFRSGAENRKINQEKIEEYKQEMSDLRYELEHAVEGKVHVFDTAYPQSKILIASDQYKVTNEIQFATFRFKDDKVVYDTCEIKKD